MSTLMQVGRARDYRRISLVDLAGKDFPHAGAEEGPMGADMMPRCRKLLGSKRIEFSDLHQDDTLSGLHIDMGVPVFDEAPGDSTVLGYLLFQIDPSSSLFPLVER
jgi:hypothetical protein